MTRKLFMAGTWKMNNTASEAVVLSQEISYMFEKDFAEYADVALCVPFTDLKPVRSVFEFDKIKISVGAQDVYWQDAGAYTGEVSVAMLKEVPCDFCIVGHSERRGLFGETNEDVNKKTKALIKGGIAPIVCVGESLSVRDENKTNEFVCAQVKAALAGLDDIDMAKVVVAYEPIWAIGTGRTATPEQAQEVCAAIRETLREMFGEKVANATRVLYGGSMNPGNVEGLLAQADIDGGLIGGASLKSNSFIDLVKACVK